MTEPYQITPNHTSSDLDEVLELLTFDQIRFVIARNDTPKDKDAAENIGVSPNTVKYWKQEGAPIDKALKLMGRDGVVTARHILRRNVAKAAAVKVAGLDDADSKVRQSAASEILDRELGGAVQKVEATVRVIGIDLDAV